eukprot:GEMP01038134.1.p1 GENE.GEMP01038134.1~~GEMP01038134.1.p1  ORF type:complete len:260 (+),score=53.73 GEMP01038134.1:162-941(+)
MNTQLLRNMAHNAPLPSVTRCPEPVQSSRMLPVCSPGKKSSNALTPSSQMSWTVTRQEMGVSSDSDSVDGAGKVLSTDAHRDLARCLSTGLKSVEQAREHLVGSTPNSPLNRKSKAAFLLPSFEQSMEIKTLFPRHDASVRNSHASHVSRNSSRELTPRGSNISQNVMAVKRKVIIPIVGQRYVVLQPWVTLRENADIYTHSPIICEVYMGYAVRILRYEQQAGDKLRVQVLTDDEKVGWCTLTTEFGEALLRLAPEEV